MTICYADLNDPAIKSGCNSAGEIILTANEARQIMIDSIKSWKSLPDEDIEYGELKGPVAENSARFYFEVTEHDRSTGETVDELYEVNKITRQVLRVVEEID